MSLPIAMLTFLLIQSFLLQSAIANNDELLISAARTAKQKANICRSYLAPSTIPGAGLGIFTAFPLAPGDELVTGDVTIPIVDFDYYHDRGSDYWPWDDYTWDGFHMGMLADSDTGSVSAYAPGLDCAINCHSALNNVDKRIPVYDLELPHRYQYPSAGSMTPYVNGTTIAMSHIPAGSELFKGYGDHWFTTRTSIFGNLPLTDDFPRAQELAKSLVSLFDNQMSFLDKPTKEHLYKVITDLDTRTTNALPKKFDKLQQVVDKGISSIYQPGAIRPNLSTMPEARCLDSIYASKSTIEGAGRGAFASRSFSKGDIITGTPLLHLPNKTLFEMFRWDSELGAPDYSKVTGYQILKNYCFGHAETTVLLCPYGAGITLINHDRERANVEIKWAKDGHVGHHDFMLGLSVDELQQVQGPRMGWDFLALKDIKQDEEIFLDYGDEWIEAWETYVKQWVPRSQDADYMPSEQWNGNPENEILRTSNEKAYPENIQIRCHTAVRDEEEIGDTTGWEYYHLWDLSTKGEPCSIIERISANNVEDGSYIYTVEYDDGEQVEGVERKLISFVDTVYSTDIHLPGRFRHEAMMPDALLPSKWKNVKGSNNDDNESEEL